MWTQALTSSETVTEVPSAQGKGNPEEEAFLKTTISSLSVSRAEVLGWQGRDPLDAARVLPAAPVSAGHSCLRRHAAVSPVCSVTLCACLLLTKT